MKSDSPYEPVIGLEVHAQLATRSKIFCGCSTTFGADPNSHACPVCLGLPGALPVLNREAVEFAIRLILAVGGQVSERSVFARKNYFYPDLPKGYQISQFDVPIGQGGSVEFVCDLHSAHKVQVGLIRIHLEEDAGKSLHNEDPADDSTLVDVNRCGVPLLEIVSKPEIRSPRDASLYLQQMHQILQYLGICTGNMEEGALRCDANVSIRPAGSTVLGTRTELKNMNSFRAVERALSVEIGRQTELVRDGQLIRQETMLWDEKSQTVHPMRSKEESSDYRYFPDPDLLPLQISSSWVDSVRASLPELPMARAARLAAQYGIPDYDASVLTETRELADYYEQTVAVFTDGKKASNWIMTEVLRILKEKSIGISSFPVRPEHLGQLLATVSDGTISGTAAKTVFEQMVVTGKSPKDIVTEGGFAQISDGTMLGHLVDRVLDENQDQVATYRSGNQRVLAFFVGQVMKNSKGKANPQRISELLKERLDRS